MGDVYDYSWARPSADSIKAAGGTGVIRYLGHDRTGKCITLDEYEQLKAAGLEVGLVWELWATRAKEGYDAGAADARDANLQADMLGYPTDAAIYYACDTHAIGSLTAAYYFAGVASVPGRPVGFYGGDDPGLALLDRGIVTYFWQAGAKSWSHEYPNPSAHLVQLVGTPVPGTDRNIAQAPWGAAKENSMPTGQDLVDHALAKRGHPYSWTNRFGPDNYDCSGLVTACLWELGINPSGTNSTGLELWANAEGQPTIDPADVLHTPGALLYVWGYGAEGHVAISMGDGQHIVETPSSEGHRVGVSSFWRHNWTGASLVPGIHDQGATVNPTLKKGDSSLHVASLQLKLNREANAGLEVDGRFGEATHAAVVAFQRFWSEKGVNLAPDEVRWGIVGESTWSLLDWVEKLPDVVDDPPNPKPEPAPAPPPAPSQSGLTLDVVLWLALRDGEDYQTFRTELQRMISERGFVE